MPSSPVDLELGELLAMSRRLRPPVLTPGTRPPVGQRSGRRRAQGLDLDGLTPYVAGDDVRSIDWRATARTGQVQVRRYLSDAHIALLIVIDLDELMFFGTSQRLLAKTAALAAARLAWQALRLQEPVGLAILPEGPVMRPRRGRAWVLRLLETLLTAYRREYPPSQCHIQLDAALSSLAIGDGLVWISEPLGAGAPADDKLAGLANRFEASAVWVEDSVLDRHIPAGRYPFLSPQGDRNAGAMSRQQAKTWPEHIKAMRGARRNALLDAGWQIVHAANLVPEADYGQAA